jgi:selenocysteine lyase/cysteine desulfurase
MISCQRHRFQIPEDVAYLNCAYTAPLLDVARQAGQAAIAEKGTPWRITAGHFITSMNGVRERFAQLVGAIADHVALIPSVSYGIALAARNLPVAKGQTLVLCQDQFPSNVYSWRGLAAERGAGIETVRRPGDDDWTAAVLDRIGPDTALVAAMPCHWTDGTYLDLTAIGERCRKVGAALVVDGTQALGAIPFSVSDVRPDFLVTTAHKWLLGPYSFGFCYVHPRWHSGRPLEENWLNREGSEDFSRLVEYRDGYQPGARRFDVGEASNFILAPIAAAALEQILSWGVERIAATLRGITDAIAERASSLGIRTAPDRCRAGHMIGLRKKGGWPSDLAARLAAARVYVSVRGDSIRVAPHLYNTEKDVDRLFSVLETA